MLRAVNRELGVTIVVVTHDALVSEQVKRTVAIRDGRTSTETLRRRTTSDAGEHVTSDEYAVLDRVGRLQLPQAYVEALGLAATRAPGARGRPRHCLAGPRRHSLPTAGRSRSDGSAMTQQTPTWLRAPVERVEPVVAPMVETQRPVRDYPMPGGVVHAVRDVTIQVARGELVALRGRSGSGKTTLLSMLGGLDRPTPRQCHRRRPDSLRTGRSELISFRRRSSASSSRPSACSRSCPRPRTSRCRCGSSCGPKEREQRVSRAARVWSAWATAPTTGRTSCRAASSSASRSPGRWPTGRRCSSPTSRPASSTRGPAADHAAAPALVRQRGRHGARRHPRPDADRPRRPRHRAAGRPGRGCRGYDVGRVICVCRYALNLIPR